MGYPSPARTGWGTPLARSGWGTPPVQVMLGQVMPRVVRLLRFPTEGLSCLCVISKFQNINFILLCHQMHVRYHVKFYE